MYAREMADAMRDLPPRAWELKRTRAWATAGAVSFVVGGALTTATLALMPDGNSTFSALGGLLMFVAFLGLALSIKAWSDWRRVRRIRRACAKLGCSAWTAVHHVARTTERRECRLVRRGFDWIAARSQLVDNVTESNFFVVLPLALFASKYGIRGAILARMEQELVASDGSPTFAARIVVEKWPSGATRVELRFWLVLVVETLRRGGLTPSAVTVVDVVCPRRIVRDPATSGVYDVEFELPPGAPPGDVLADPPMYWRLVLEGGEEPFVFRAVFNAAICRLDELPVSS